MDEPVNSQPHPLLLSPVLHSILEFLPISDILNCRQVCQVWNKTSVKILRQVKTIKFRMKLEYLEEFTELMRSSQDFPYSRFELEFYHMDDKSVQDFINLVGPRTFSLQLNNCRSTTTKLYEILQVLQNLHSFSINCDPIEDTGRLPEDLTFPKLTSLSLLGEFCRNDGFLMDLVRSAVNLKSFSVRCYDRLDDFSAFEQLCFKIFLLNESVQNHVENFQIEFRMNENHVVSLWKKKLEKLKYLHINLDRAVQPGTVVKLLNSYSSTLRKLDLDFTTCNNTDDSVNANDDHSEENAGSNMKQQYNIPKMGHLHRLCLTNFKGSLSFLNHCEVLKYLTLVNCDVSASTLAGVNVHQNLHSLVSTTKLNQHICTEIAHLFPVLKELNTDLDDVALRVVFDLMVQLEELIVIGDQITDEGITGIDNIFELMTIYDSINQLDDGLIEPSLSLVHQIPELRIYPSITKLQNLRKLKVQDASSLTDASVRYGIILCKHLLEISFLNSHVTDASLEVIADNLTHLGKLELLSTITKFTTSGRNYIQNKIHGCDLILGQRDLMNLFRPRQPGN